MIFWAGFLAGVILTLVAVVVGMRAMMLVEYDSRLGFDETLEELKKSIKAAGWNIPNVVDMKESIVKHGIEFGPKVKLIKLCKPKYAAEVLGDARHVACLMPCTIAVYESDDGKVKISKMNTGLMGKVFGGTIARVMGGAVADDEKKMLDGIVDR